jgi:hypothetical protein
MMKGYGTVFGNMLIPNGDTLAPGGSIGTLNETGNLVLDGTYQAEVNNSPAADLMNVAGALTLTANSFLQLPAANTYDNLTSLTILSATGGVTGTFGTVDPNLPANYSVVYNSNSVVLQPVPEPGTLLLTSLAAAGGLGWWRRRRAAG